MSSKRYTVACLTGNGVGPEVIAEASRALEAASRLHGFVVDEDHAPFGTDALMRYGHPYPLPSRRAVLAADAVLVAPGVDEPLDAIEDELDLRASIVRVRTDRRHELSILSPLSEDAWSWTLQRAFAVAAAGRARVSLVGVDESWAAHAAEAERTHEGFDVERLAAAAAMRGLVLAAESFDVAVCTPELAATAAELAGSSARRRVATWGQLAATGPSLFGAFEATGSELAGHGVVDPSSTLLAAALLLGEGLGERRAAATLASAVGRTDVAASTRAVADTVLESLPLGLEVEFYREAV